MQPALRRATALDAPAAAALVLALSPPFFVEPDGAGAEAFLASISETRQALFMRDYRYLVAEVAGELVGVAALRPPCHLFHLFVAQRWQGQGLGQRLFDALLQGSDTALPLTVNASLPAIGFYRRQGFELEGEVQSRDGIRFQAMRRLA
jgi:GNAT superfamily N-acetyltransferase